MEFVFVLWWNIYDFRNNADLLEIALIKYAQSNDVLILGEYNPKKITNKTKETIKGTLPYEYYIPYNDQDYGMMFFSKEPLTEFKFQNYNNGGRFLASCNYKNIKIYATHLEQDWLLQYPNENPYISKMKILRNIIWGKENITIKQAEEMFNELQKEKEDHIVLGDFNIFPSFLGLKTRLYSKMKQLGYYSNIKDITWESNVIKSSKLPNLTIDQVFSTNKKIISEKKVYPTKSSDHRPIQLKLNNQK